MKSKSVKKQYNKLSLEANNELKNVIRDIKIYNQIIDEDVIRIESNYLTHKLENKNIGKKEINVAIDKLYKYFGYKREDM